ncbi:MAG: hypothetical protein M1457_12035 [bacterium]|nr:hypothetical protein [bacterium]
MFRVLSAAIVLAAIPLTFAGSAGGQTPTGELKLLFSDPQDIADTWGKLHFGATSMTLIRACEDPGFRLACCLPRGDGSWDVYGQIFAPGPGAGGPGSKSTWKLVHATTRDGERFENLQTVYESEPGPWTDHLGLAYNPEAKEFLALKLKIDDNGFAYQAYFSPDGRNWKEYPANPLFYDGDSMGLFWSANARRFICSSKSLQPFAKHIPDHGGTHPQNKNDNLRDRRVIVIRSSADGRHWQPLVSMMDVWNRIGNYQPVPSQYMLTPDANDPPDMEFYRGIGFWYHDRSYMIALNYAASPLTPRKHGPQLDTEWWVSRDGLTWDRPYRGINALGAAFPGYPCITHNPMMIDGMLLFHFGNQLFGMKQDRISYVGARANGEFSTPPFSMPDADLRLNAAAPSPDRAFAAGQAYVMAAVLDDKGKIVPGFEPGKCVIQNADAIDLPLRWNGKSARELAGRNVRLRFFLRGANIYAVTSAATAQ